MASFPPMRLHESEPITTEAALTRLQSYLALSAVKENAYLLPNATLSSTGPTAKGDSTSNLTIHNLKRVEAGLRGEWLAPNLDLEGEVDNTLVRTGLGSGINGVGNIGEGGEEWQDLDEYQREQSIENGEVTPEITEVGQQGEKMVQIDVDNAADEEDTENAVIDKEARRRAKKERKEQERRDRVKKQVKKG